MQYTDKRDDPSNQVNDRLAETSQSTSCDQNRAEGAYKDKKTPHPENKPKSFIPWSFCFEIALVIAACTSAAVGMDGFLYFHVFPGYLA